MLARFSSLTRFVPRVSNSGMIAAAYSTAAKEVLVEGTASGRVAILNRPQALNSLSLNMVRELTALYKECVADSNNKLIVLKGAGEKAFCAGGDIRAISEAAQSNDAAVRRIARDFFYEEYQLDYLIATLPKAHIALIDGFTMGGGVGVSVHGRFRVCTEKTVFAMPETGIGFFCDVGGSHALTHLTRGQLGMYLGLTGARLKGKAVKDAGFATHFVSSGQLAALENDLIALAGKLQSENADNAAVVSAIDALLNQYEEKNPQKDNAGEGPTAQHLVLIDQVFSAGSVDIIMEKLEQLIDSSSSSESEIAWARATRSSLMRMSPTALKVVYKQLRNGNNLGLKECFQMEFRMSQHFMHGHDFVEGVRALLVDKDKNPKWKPASISEVTDEMVDKFFTPVGEEWQPLQL